MRYCFGPCIHAIHAFSVITRCISVRLIQTVINEPCFEGWKVSSSLPALVLRACRTGFRPLRSPLYHQTHTTKRCAACTPGSADVNNLGNVNCVLRAPPSGRVALLHRRPVFHAKSIRSFSLRKLKAEKQLQGAPGSSGLQLSSQIGAHQRQRVINEERLGPNLVYLKKNFLKGATYQAWPTLRPGLYINWKTCINISNG